jgi:hypothetical protein
MQMSELLSKIRGIGDNPPKPPKSDAQAAGGQ